MALYSETFANLTNWTEIGQSGIFSIVSNQLLATANASPTRSGLSYNTQLASISQYAKFQVISSTGSGQRQPRLLFRRTGTSGDIFYSIGGEIGSQYVYWSYHTDDADMLPGADIASAATGFSSVLANGDWIGAEVTGTGTGTVLRAWKWASDPGTRDNWGVASVQFTTDPGAGAADTGLYVGLRIFLQTSGDTITMDTWSAGDLGDISPMGPFLPTAAENIGEAPWNDANCGWVNPNNIFGAGEAEVTHSSFDSPDQTFVLKAYGFDFSAIPDNATIDGVQVVINARYAVAAVSLDLCQLLDISRAKVGTNKYATPQALTTSAADYTIGGAADKWGNALDAAWVKGPDFGVAIGALAGGTNSDVFINSVTMQIWYTAAVAKSLADSGSGAEAQTIQATLPIAQTGSGVDAQVIAAVLALAETGAGADVLSVVQEVLKSLADSGAGSDAIAELISSLAASDSGAGTDLVASIQAALVMAETGSGADVVAALEAALDLAESGGGSDLIAVLSASLPILESGSGDDAMSLDIEEGIDKDLSDSGSGVDILILAIDALLADAGSGTDAQTIYAEIFL